jgi:CRP-like cAMP-binding protein
VKGSVKLTVLSEQGKEAVVGILELGQFFGEGCLNGHPLRIASGSKLGQQSQAPGKDNRNPQRAARPTSNSDT